jgi:hypothetical protein
MRMRSDSACRFSGESVRLPRVVAEAGRFSAAGREADFLPADAAAEAGVRALVAPVPLPSPDVFTGGAAAMSMPNTSESSSLASILWPSGRLPVAAPDPALAINS